MSPGTGFTSGKSIEFEARTGTPKWFRRALHVPFSDGEVIVGSAAIHYIAWGVPGRRGLVFVHGGGAHAHWWTHIAATFAVRRTRSRCAGHRDP